MYATPSAHAAEAIRKHPPSTINIRLRTIAPPRPGDTPSPCNLYRSEQCVRQRAQGTGLPKVVLDKMPGAPISRGLSRIGSSWFGRRCRIEPATRKFHNAFVTGPFGY